jgi:hypothetical protein
MKALERMRSKNQEASRQGVTKVTEGAFGAFGTPLNQGAEVFSPTPAKEPPPPDLIGEPCSTCGSQERWRWVDGSLLCRPGLIHDDHLGRDRKIQ